MEERRKIQKRTLLIFTSIYVKVSVDQGKRL